MDHLKIERRNIIPKLLWLLAIAPLLTTALLLILSVVVAFELSGNFIENLGMIILGAPIAIWYIKSKPEAIFYALAAFVVTVLVYRFVHAYSYDKWYKPGFKTGVALLLLSTSLIAGNILVVVISGLGKLGSL